MAHSSHPGNTFLPARYLHSLPVISVEMDGWIHSAVNTSLGDTSTVSLFRAQLPDSLALASSSNVSIYGQAVTLTADSVASGGIRISFYSCQTRISWARDHCLVAQLSSVISSLPPGRHSLKAIYSGSAKVILLFSLRLFSTR